MALGILLTGGIGSGKTTLARMLEGRGVPVFYSDLEARDLYTPELVSRLEEAFGASLLTPEGELDKRALAGEIFSSAIKREKLESIIYPLLRERYLLWKSFFERRPFVVFESAIALSKKQFQGLWDGVVLVKAPQEQRLSRVALRDSLSPEEVLSRMQAQELPEQVGAVIDNNGSIQELALACEDVFFSENGYICKILKG